jgi:hypothetical protein
MSEILEAIKVWEQQNSPTIKGLDVAKQNAISQALNFFNKKFGGEGELMPIIEEKIIIETPITTLPNKGIPLRSIGIVYGNDTFTFDTFENAQTWIQDRYNFAEMKQPFYIDCLLSWEDGSQVLTKNKIRVNENEEDSFNPNFDKLNKFLFIKFVATESNWIEVNMKSYFTSWDWQIDEKSKDFSIDDKIKYIGEDTEYNKNGDIGVITDVVKYKNGDLDFEVKFESKNTKFMLPKYKLELVQETPTSVETKEAEEEVLFTDLEELENEIESINFEELEKLDKELDDLF